MIRYLHRGQAAYDGMLCIGQRFAKCLSALVRGALAPQALTVHDRRDRAFRGIVARI